MRVTPSRRTMGGAEPFPLMRFRSEAAGPEAGAAARGRRLERAGGLGAGLIRGQDRADDHRHALGEALAFHFGALAIGQTDAHRADRELAEVVHVPEDRTAAGADP